MNRRSRSKQTMTLGLVGIVGLLVVTVILKSESGKSEGANSSRDVKAAAHDPVTTLELTPDQLTSIKIQAVGTFLFPVEKDTVGTISFADDLSVQVFPSYQGKIIKALA